MIKVIGVRFRTAGKIYFFDPGKLTIKRGDHVIVETARGIEYGTVVGDPREVEEKSVIQPLKPVLRIATERDDEQEAANKVKEKEAFKICLEKIRKHGLEMKLIDAEYTFDNNKVLFYFTADGRIDFRELVKDLAGVFKTRIELRQIGVRDETKIIGGIGICGRPLCCHSYLSDFIPVSIKMAKEQNLSLNPTKISGVCGRLMCCLKNEEDTYEELNRRLPNIGDTVTAEDGSKGEVQSVNVLRQLVKVVVEEGDTKEIREYEVGKLHFKRKHTKKERMEFSAEELAELERLETVELDELSGENADRKNSSDTEREGGRGNHDRQDNRRDRNQDNRGRRQRDNEDRIEAIDNSRKENGASEEDREGDRRDNRGDRRFRNGGRPNQSGHGERNQNRNQERSQDSNRGQERRQEKNSENRQDGGRQGERHFRRDRRNRQGRKPEQNENAGSGAETRGEN